MTRESKNRILFVYDSLAQVESGRPTGAGKGRSMACDKCGFLLSSGHRHPLSCPVGLAIAALAEIIPPYGQRAEWLANDDPEVG